ncbi:Protein GrpE [uncultured archaeon]|nr:Protein GrpE [uncultured archaeon]
MDENQSSGEPEVKTEIAHEKKRIHHKKDAIPAPHDAENPAPQAKPPDATPEKKPAPPAVQPAAQAPAAEVPKPALHKKEPQKNPLDVLLHKKPEAPALPPVAPKDDSARKIADLTDRLMRLQAEFDNYQKRTAKEKEQTARQAEAKMMLRFLPLYEELELAEREVGRLSDQNLKKGILLVLFKLKATFDKEGLQPMKLVGEKFDPFRHETAMKEDSDKPEGTIVNVIQPGYLFKGEVLRHAMVSVSSGKTPQAKTETPAPAAVAEQKKEG